MNTIKHKKGMRSQAQAITSSMGTCIINMYNLVPMRSAIEQSKV